MHLRVVGKMNEQEACELLKDSSHGAMEDRLEAIGVLADKDQYIGLILEVAGRTDEKHTEFPHVLRMAGVSLLKHESPERYALVEKLLLKDCHKKDSQDGALFRLVELARELMSKEAVKMLTHIASVGSSEVQQMLLKRCPRLSPADQYLIVTPIIHNADADLALEAIELLTTRALARSSEVQDLFVDIAIGHRDLDESVRIRTIENLSAIKKLPHIHEALKLIVANTDNSREIQSVTKKTLRQEH